MCVCVCERVSNWVQTSDYCDADSETDDAKNERFAEMRTVFLKISDPLGSRVNRVLFRFSARARSRVWMCKAWSECLLSKLSSCELIGLFYAMRTRMTDNSTTICVCFQSISFKNDFVIFFMSLSHLDRLNSFKRWWGLRYLQLVNLCRMKLTSAALVLERNVFHASLPPIVQCA